MADKQETQKAVVQGANQQANVKPPEKPAFPEPANYVRPGVRPPGDNGINPAAEEAPKKAPEKK